MKLSFVAILAISTASYATELKFDPGIGFTVERMKQPPNAAMSNEQLSAQLNHCVRDHATLYIDPKSHRHMKWDNTPEGDICTTLERDAISRAIEYQKSIQVAP